VSAIRDDAQAAWALTQQRLAAAQAAAQAAEAARKAAEQGANRWPAADSRCKTAASNSSARSAAPGSKAAPA